MALARRALLSLALIALFAPPSSAQKPADPATPRGVLLISIDTLRADAVGSPGLGRGADAPSDTPALDRLARDSVVFGNAYAPIPHTLPSHVSLFTGLQPGLHRVLRREDRLAETVESLPARLAAEGWQTAGIVSNYWLAPIHGLDRGFERYRFFDPEEHRAGSIARFAVSEIDRLSAGEAPWLLFVHVMDPHSDAAKDGSTTPYTASEPFRGEGDWAADDPRFCSDGACATHRLQRANRVGRLLDSRLIDQVRSHYRAGVRETDAALAVLFDHLRERQLYDDVLILVSSDHGEALGEAGRYIHSTPSEPTLRVPLLIKLDRSRSEAPKTTRVDTLVATVDIFPTLLDWLGLEAPRLTDGRSRVPWWSEDPPRDGAPRTTRAAGGDLETASSELLLRGKNRHLHALRRGTWKLVYDASTDTAELFDLTVDPLEVTDVSKRHPERAESMKARLVERLRDQRRRWSKVPAPEVAEALDAETKESLRSLGYLGGSER